MLLCLGLPLASTAVDISVVKTSDHRVVLETDLGHLVFAFYPELAPAHMKRLTHLVEQGAYDSTHFFRIIPGFIIQTSEITDRTKPLPGSLKNDKKNIRGEFTSVLKHRAGILSMARMPDDRDSASSSFSILLGDAPHLDNEYTIFGQLESGRSTIERILAVPRDGESPSSRISIKKAYVITDIPAYYAKYPREPLGSTPLSDLQVDKDVSSYFAKQEQKFKLVIILVLAIIAISFTGFVMYEKISKARLLSLQLINILICVFLMFILLTPLAHQRSWLAVLVFVSLFLTFRLMSSFESKRT